MTKSFPTALTDIEIVHQLGKGASSKVYLCRSKLDNQEYALKVIPKANVSSAIAKARILNEKAVMEQLDQCFFLRLYTTLKDEDNLYFLLEKVDGKALYHYIWETIKGRFTVAQVKFYAAQVAVAVKTLHSLGYCHRDLKTGNILLDRNKNAKLIDFGYAKKIAKNERTYTFCGTLYIMSPEMAKREGHGFATDWWALGVIIYEMAMGRPPWPYKPNYDADVENAQKNYLELILQTHKNIDFDPEVFGYSDGALPDLIRKLLQEDPVQRLGANGGHEVMAHPWFAGIDWDAMEEQLVSAPQTSVAESSDSDGELLDSTTDAMYFGDF